jgi:hypothetical protein
MVGLVKALQLNLQQIQILLLHFDLEDDRHGVEVKHLAMSMEGIINMGSVRRESVEALYTQVCAAESALQAANISSLTNASKSRQHDIVVPSVGLLRELLTGSTPQTPMLDGIKDEWCHMVELVVRGHLNNAATPKKKQKEPF